jgi:hypothetical protein
MALPENRVSRPPGLRELAKQIRSITFRASSAASSGPYRLLGKAPPDLISYLPKATSRSVLNPGASSGVFKTPQEPYEVASEKQHTFPWHDRGFRNNGT